MCMLVPVLDLGDASATAAVEVPSGRPQLRQPGRPGPVRFQVLVPGS